MSPRRQPSQMCGCGRAERRGRQRTCRLCHAEDMKKRRAAAREAGTYTLRVARETPTWNR